MNLNEFCDWIDTLPIDNDLRQNIKDNASEVVYNEIADTTDLTGYDEEEH